MATTSISQPPEIFNEQMVAHVKESLSVKSAQLPNKHQPPIRQKRSKNDEGRKPMLVDYFCTKIASNGITQ